MNYKNIEYEITVRKLKHDLGYSGYGFVYLPIKGGINGKQILSNKFEYFDTEDKARGHFIYLIEKYIDENI